MHFKFFFLISLIIHQQIKKGTEKYESTEVQKINQTYTTYIFHLIMKIYFLDLIGIRW